MGFLSCWDSTGVLRKDQSRGDVCSPSPGLGAAGGCAHSQPLLEGSGLCTPRQAPSAGTGSPEDTPSLPQVKCYHKKYTARPPETSFSACSFTPGLFRAMDLCLQRRIWTTPAKVRSLPRVQTVGVGSGPSAGNPRRPHVFLSLFSPAPPVSQPIDKIITSLTKDWQLTQQRKISRETVKLLILPLSLVLCWRFEKGVVLVGI